MQDDFKSVYLRSIISLTWFYLRDRTRSIGKHSIDYIPIGKSACVKRDNIKPLVYIAIVYTKPFGVLCIQGKYAKKLETFY